jgi:hypothetical protein
MNLAERLTGPSLEYDVADPIELMTGGDREAVEGL